jgi:hypothetical protein
MKSSYETECYGMAVTAWLPGRHQPYSQAPALLALPRTLSWRAYACTYSTVLASESSFWLFSLVSSSIELSTKQVYPDVLYEP